MKAPISIVIPTLNEEKYLPLLLNSIKNQTISPSEIIVSDGGSTDKTREIAKEYGCVTVVGGNISTGRNSGAKIAKEEILLFLDADTILPPNFIEKTLNEFNARNLDVATCYTSIDGLTFVEACITDFVNYYYKITELIRPHTFGYCIFVKKNIHDKVKGFDEKVFVGEDQDYVYRASRVGKFRVLMSEKIIASLRRFKEEGNIATILKYLVIELHVLFFGKIHKKFFKFNFGSHK